MKRTDVLQRVRIAALLLTASCGGQPSHPTYEVASGPGLILVSHYASIGTHGPDADGDTIELHIDGGNATMLRRSERLVDGRWRTSQVETTPGTARQISEGWELDFPWQEALWLDGGTGPADVPATRLRLSCKPSHRRVHAANARPIDLCTRRSHWTGGEQDLAGWWCDDVERRMFLVGNGEFFTTPPGVERVLMMCCPADSDACDGWDGGLRATK